MKACLLTCTLCVCIFFFCPQTASAYTVEWLKGSPPQPILAGAHIWLDPDLPYLWDDEETTVWEDKFTVSSDAGNTGWIGLGVFSFLIGECGVYLDGRHIGYASALATITREGGWEHDEDVVGPVDMGSGDGVYDNLVLFALIEIGAEYLFHCEVTVGLEWPVSTVPPGGEVGATMAAGEWTIQLPDESPDPVPIPAPILLLGTGLLGAAGLRKIYIHKGKG